MLIRYKFKISDVRRGGSDLLSMCVFELRFTRRRFLDVALLFQTVCGGSADVKNALFWRQRNGW